VGFGLCIINLPFMIWAVSATVNALDDDLENAAANCGAPPLQAFLTVTLPVSIYNSIRSVITPDLAAVSVVYIVIAFVAVWLLDRLVGLELFLKSK